MKPTSDKVVPVLEKILRNSTLWSNLRLLVLIGLASWWTITVQKTLKSLRDEIRQMRPIVYQKQGFVKEFIYTYQDSQIVDKDLRRLYTFSASEARLFGKYTQDDERLIEHIHDSLLIPPPEALKVHPDHDTSKGLADRVHAHFLQMNGTEGFYVEYVARDGYFMSNTLKLETKYQWKGLLVEPDPQHFLMLKKRGRNAWLLPTCLSMENRTTLVRFNSQTPDPKVDASGTLDLHCMPLFSVLKALHLNTSIGAVILDVGQDALGILKSVPFYDIDIKIVAVKHTAIVNGRNEVLIIMNENGYTEVAPLPDERATNEWYSDYVLLLQNERKVKKEEEKIEEPEVPTDEQETTVAPA